MALKFTLKKKDYENDERTVPTEDFFNRLVNMHRDVERIKEIPRTEVKK